MEGPRQHPYRCRFPAGPVAGGHLPTGYVGAGPAPAGAPGARVEIDRLEANSKFFRSLVVVSTAFAAHFLLRDQSPAMGVATIVIGILSYQRYVEERWKMTEFSYATAVIAHAASAKPESPPVAVE